MKKTKRALTYSLLVFLLAPIAFNSLVTSVLFIIGMYFALYSKRIAKREAIVNKRWIVMFLLNLTGLLTAIEIGYIEKTDKREPAWFQAISANQNYIGTQPYLRQINFSFDSLKIEHSQIGKVNLSITDAQAAPPDAPPEE